MMADQQKYQIAMRIQNPDFEMLTLAQEYGVDPTRLSETLDRVPQEYRERVSFAVGFHLIHQPEEARRDLGKQIVDSIMQLQEVDGERRALVSIKDYQRPRHELMFEFQTGWETWHRVLGFKISPARYQEITFPIYSDLPALDRTPTVRDYSTRQLAGELWARFKRWFPLRPENSAKRHANSVTDFGEWMNGPVRVLGGRWFQKVYLFDREIGPVRVTFEHDARANTWTAYLYGHLARMDDVVLGERRARNRDLVVLDNKDKLTWARAMDCKIAPGEWDRLMVRYNETLPLSRSLEKRVFWRLTVDIDGPVFLTRRDK